MLTPTGKCLQVRGPRAELRAVGEFSTLQSLPLACEIPKEEEVCWGQGTSPQEEAIQSSSNQHEGLKFKALCHNISSRGRSTCSLTCQQERITEL